MKPTWPRMLGDNVAEARNGWLTEAIDDPQEYAQQQQSDFLADTNHEGEMTDFHCLRNTRSTWLAKTGAHPKVVQTVVRYSTITLTMDTYGHLFPGQETDAVDQLRRMLVTPPPRPFGRPERTTLRQTPRKARSARRSSQDAKRNEDMRHAATTEPSCPRKKNRPSLCKLLT